MVILVADPEVDFRAQVIDFLNDKSQFDVIEVANSREEAIQKTRDLQPDFILLEIDFPDGDGLDLIEKIHETSNGSVVVIVTHNDSQTHLLKAFRCGAKGYLLKDHSVFTMLPLLRSVDEIYFLISDRLAHLILSVYNQLMLDLDEQLNLGRLSLRELDVFKLVCNGATNQYIAGRLVISENTVRIHIRNILRKLRLKNRHEVREKYISSLQVHLDWRTSSSEPLYLDPVSAFSSVETSHNGNH